MKVTFTGNSSLAKIHQPLLEFAIIITVCDINGTDSAIKPTRRYEIRIYLHQFKNYFLTYNPLFYIFNPFQSEFSSESETTGNH